MSRRRVVAVGRRRPWRPLTITLLPKEEAGRRSQPTTGRERLETARERKVAERRWEIN
jgi:hypothetical protein